MTSPGTLASVLARVLGVSEDFVMWQARMLREAGMLTKGGRGKSAAKMTVTDAANLLIATNTSSGKDAPVNVPRFRMLRCIRSYSRADHSPTRVAYEAEFDKRIAFMGERESRLGDVLERLITEIHGDVGDFLATEVTAYIKDAQEKEATELAKIAFGQLNSRLSPVFIRVIFYRPWPAASIEIGRLNGSTTELFLKSDFLYEEHLNMDEGQAKQISTLGDGDQRHSTTIGFRTLNAIAEVLNT